jgi:hydrogenase/urease accessory protein HupE
MLIRLLRYWAVIVVISTLIVSIVPQKAEMHALDVSYGRWQIDGNQIQVTMLMDPYLLGRIGPYDDNHDSAMSESELQKFVSAYLLPYMGDKLSIQSDGKYLNFTFEGAQLKDGLVEVKSSFGSDFKLETIKIDYRMFLDETDGLHACLSEIVIPSLSNPVNHAFSSKYPVWEGSVLSSFYIWQSVGSSIALGMEHIFTGYDHILFVIALIMIGLSAKQLLGVITSFTIAHSITLFLGAMQIVQLNSRFVESAIAISICYIALENILSKDIKYRWILTFGFGLIHGFGFASMLESFDFSKINLVYTLLTFNLGIEIGQLIIIAILMPILYWLKQKVSFRKLTVGVSSLILAMGLLWLTERVFNIPILGI